MRLLVLFLGLLGLVLPALGSPLFGTPSFTATTIDVSAQSTASTTSDGLLSKSNHPASFSSMTTIPDPPVGASTTVKPATDSSNPFVEPPRTPVMPSVLGTGSTQLPHPPHYGTGFPHGPTGGRPAHTESQGPMKTGTATTTRGPKKPHAPTRSPCVNGTTSVDVSLHAPHLTGTGTTTSTKKHQWGGMTAAPYGPSKTSDPEAGRPEWSEYPDAPNRSVPTTSKEPTTTEKPATISWRPAPSVTEIEEPVKRASRPCPSPKVNPQPPFNFICPGDDGCDDPVLNPNPPYGLLCPQ